MTLIVLNFKTYRESTGLEAVRLARICEEVSRDHSSRLWLFLRWQISPALPGQ